jgi:hypothetical protein
MKRLKEKTRRINIQINMLDKCIDKKSPDGSMQGSTIEASTINDTEKRMSEF